MTGTRTRTLAAELLADERTLERVAVRVLEDAFTEAVPDYWERRAERFEAARPRPGDFPGRAGQAALDAADARLAATAQACREAAELARTTRPWWVADLVAEEVADAVA